MFNTFCACKKAVGKILRRFPVYYFVNALRYYIANHVVSAVPCCRIRLFYYRLFLGLNIGKNTNVSMNQFITGYYNSCRISIGDNCVINRRCYLDGREGIVIGNNVNISFETSIITLQHDVRCPNFSCKGAKVIINDNAWIGARSMILPGVTIGQGAVVAAGSVVVRDVPPYDVVGGTPARKISERAKDLDYKTCFFPYFDTDICNE